MLAKTPVQEVKMGQKDHSQTPPYTGSGPYIQLQMLRAYLFASVTDSKEGRMW